VASGRRATDRRREASQLKNATAFPAVHCVGIDVDPVSIGLAQELIRDRGLTDRVAAHLVEGYAWPARLHCQTLRHSAAGTGAVSGITTRQLGAVGVCDQVVATRRAARSPRLRQRTARSTAPRVAPDPRRNCRLLRVVIGQLNPAPAERRAVAHGYAAAAVSDAISSSSQSNPAWPTHSDRRR
jgi:hypothetical protein